MTDQRPSIRLLPKTDPRPIRRGFPWVYQNQLVMDRRSRAIAPGTLVEIQDNARNPVALATYNPNSKIAARVLARDVNEQIDVGWIKAKLTDALALRERLFDRPYYRLVHAEADGFPGLIIDRFAELAVVQPNTVWADSQVEVICDALADVAGIQTVVMNGHGRARQLDGLPETLEVLRGDAPTEPISVPMNGATYMADVMGGQKTGLFYDQRPNHAFAARLAPCARVLDVFSHVGGFSLAALNGGAAEALAVDGSAAALSLAEQGANASGFTEKFQTRQGDAFDVMQALADEGAQFDVVICDPPAFAPQKSALEPGLRAYERVAKLGAALVAPGGYLGLCSCSHAADLPAFRKASVRGIGRAGRDAQLIHTGFAGPDHPVLPQLAETAYLKALFFRVKS